MKICALALLAVLGCGSAKETKPAQGSAVPVERPSVTDPIGFCARTTNLILARRKCFPEDTSLQMALDEVAGLEAKAPAPADARRAVAAQCAVMLDSMMRVQQPKNCPLDVTDTERAELSAFLTAWYGERTAVPAQLDGAATVALTKVAELRDAACACTSTDCARAAITKLTASLGALPAESKEASDASTKMIDEATRCKQKLVFGAPAAP